MCSLVGTKGFRGRKCVCSCGFGKRRGAHRAGSAPAESQPKPRRRDPVSPRTALGAARKPGPVSGLIATWTQAHAPVPPALRGGFTASTCPLSGLRSGICLSSVGWPGRWPLKTAVFREAWGHGVGDSWAELHKRGAQGFKRATPPPPLASLHVTPNSMPFAISPASHTHSR